MARGCAAAVLVAAVVVAVVAAASCARPGPAPLFELDDDPPIHPLAGYKADFWLTWNGARIGDARESLRARDGGLRFERHERLSLRRGDALVYSETRITVVTDARLVAREVTIWQMSHDAVIRGEAHRVDAEPGAVGSRAPASDEPGEWIARYGDEEPRRLPASAVPAELVPLLCATRWQGARAPAPGTRLFDAPVILSGYGFATAPLEVRVSKGRSVVATLHTPHGLLRSRYGLEGNGTVARVIGADQSGAVRVDAQDIALPFVPPELVDSTSVAIIPAQEGARRSSEDDDPGAMDVDELAPVEPVGDDATRGIFLAPVTRDAPPVLPGQRITPGRESWYVQLRAGDFTAPGERVDLPRSIESGPDVRDPAITALAERIVNSANARDPASEIAALVRATAELVADDLAAPSHGARSTLALGRGDCTAHASLFVALAHARGIPAYLVTGYRVDGDRLTRHRWAVAAAGTTWIAVDPTHGEAPAQARLLGLAVHAGSFAELAMADELAFAGLSRMRAFWVD